MNTLPSVGQLARVEVSVTKDLVQRFVDFSGDTNPIHLDDKFADQRGYESRIAHGMAYSAFISTLIGKYLPGPGAVWTSQTLRFIAPVYVDDHLIIHGEVLTVDRVARLIRVGLKCIRGSHDIVMEGISEVSLPAVTSSRTDSVSKKLRDASPTIGEKIALVVGAGGDLGQEIVLKLLKAGYGVALAGRDYRKLKIRAERLSLDFGSKVIAVQLDVTDLESVRAAVKIIEKELGSIKVVVHAATAPLHAVPLNDLCLSRMTEHLNVQVVGLLNLFKACVPSMIDHRRGVFIFVGSTVASGKLPKGLTGYAAAKSAASTLIKGIAAEYGPRGIRANVVSPSFLETSLNAGISLRAKALIAARIPLRRLGTVSEIADAIEYLAGDRGQFINGHELIIDGGERLT